MVSNQIRVIVVDDHALFRIGVIQTLESDKTIRVVGEGSSGAEAVELATLHTPDIALLDILMPGSGIHAAECMMKLPNPAKIVMLTGSEKQDDILGAIEAGVAGYLLKGISAIDLVSAVKIIAAGGSFMSPDLASRMVTRLIKPSVADALSSLSRQEERTLRLVASGLSNRQIGETLGIGEKSVKSTMTRAMAKLGVRNRVEATIVTRQGWGEPDVTVERDGAKTV